MDKIICVGKNYLKHARELGDAVPTEPLYFLKPPSVLCRAEGVKGKVELPGGDEVHHEIELVLRIGKDPAGKFQFSHFTFGLDLTRRELQSRLKKAGQPWEKAKVFKNSAIVGPLFPLAKLPEVMSTSFMLQVNGETRQNGLPSDMRWTPEELLLDVQNWFPLCEGDLLFTGTPEGVGPMRHGDQLEVRGGPVLYSFTCTKGS